MSKKGEIKLYGYCCDYEGNRGQFTVRVPIEVWARKGSIEVHTGNVTIEWTHKDRYVPGVEFDDYPGFEEEG